MQMRRRNKKIALLASSLILGIVLWSQMSVIAVVLKKYRKEYRKRLGKTRFENIICDKSI